MIVLDTNVVSELMKPAEISKIQTWSKQLPLQEAYTTAVTEAEMRYGIALLPDGTRKQALLTALNNFFMIKLAGRVLPFDQKTATPYGIILADRRKIGRPIEPLDAQIAAIAKVHGATLATRNIPDFEHTGVTLINP